MKPIRRFSVLTLILLTFAAPASAFCEGRNLLPEMSQSIRDRLAKVSEEPFSRGRIWQAEKDGKVSTLFGTIHLPDPAFSIIPDIVAARIEAARLVMIELTIEEEQAMQVAIMGPPSAIQNRDGRRLSEELDDADWRMVQKAIAGYGLTGPVIDKLEPWFLGMMLSVPPCVTRAQLAGEAILDRNIEEWAILNSVPVEGLEEHTELLGLLTGTSYEDSLAQLVLAASTSQQNVDYLTTMSALYQSGDIQAIWELGVVTTEEAMGAEALPALEEFQDLLLTQRNANWSDTLIPALEMGDVVVAVGALHLGGEHGLLPLLEAHGFTLSQLPE